MTWFGFKKALSGLAELTFHAACAGCAERISAPGFCDDCAFSIERRTGPRCSTCDVGLPTEGPARRCGRCLKRRPAFDGARGLYDYAGPVGDAIRRGKYGRRPDAMRQVAKSLKADLDGSALGRLDWVLPVPLHTSRLRLRGYSPPLVLAHGASQVLGLPLKRRVIRRSRDTPSQAGLTDAQRQLNVRGAFSCARDLKGRSILLVDDVMTTGATFDAVARVLKRAGASRVFALAAASVDRTL